MKNVMFVADDRYAQHLGVTLLSVLETAREPSDFHFHVLDGGIREENREKLASIARTHRASLEFVAVPVEAFSSFPISDHISHATYYRIMGPQLLSPDVQRALYMDCDVVVLGPIDDLWDLEMGGTVVAAAQEFSTFERHESLEMPAGAPYFNAGILLVDCPKWREEDVTRKAMEFISRNPDKVLFWDQDALNHVLAGRWKELDPVWNLQALAYIFPELDGLRRKVEPGCRIMHFSSPSKPWEYVNEHPRKSEYYRVLRRTPWAGWTPPDATPARRIKRLALSVLPKGFRTRVAGFLQGRTRR